MILVRAPFRLPLGGGGTDLPAYYKHYGGFLITAAIDKYMYINVNQPAVFNKIKINYTRTEIVDVGDIKAIKHDIVRESLKYLNINEPLEIHSMADLAAGTGMGSSSSYAVALLKGLNTMIRKYIPVQELAEEACKIEIDLIGKPIGKQDQYAAAFGGITQLEIDKAGNVRATPLSLDHEVIVELENRLMLFYTNIERDANEILGEQSSKIASSVINSSNSTEKRDEKNEGRGADQSMHAIKEIGYRIGDALQRGDVSEIGRLMHEHWITKKSVSTKMSNLAIDDWYTLAMENGALGGKIMGAGGGGFFVFCVDEGKRKHLRKTMENAGLTYMGFRFDFEGVKVLANV